VVIDDMEFCRDFLTDLLQERGYQVSSFDSARSFVVCAAAEERCPYTQPCADLVLLDNQMPGLSGIDFLTQQRAKGCQLKASQFAIFSGSWTPDEEKCVENFGCQIFSKPYDVNALFNWLDNLPKLNQTIPA
jgi:CheY-like chemotaxis protein